MYTPIPRQIEDLWNVVWGILTCPKCGVPMHEYEMQEHGYNKYIDTNITWIIARHRCNIKTKSEEEMVLINSIVREKMKKFRNEHPGCTFDEQMEYYNFNLRKFNEQ